MEQNVKTQNLKDKIKNLKTADEIISPTENNKKPVEPIKTETVTTYQAESGTEISLSPQIVRNFLVSGDGTPTDKEIDNFIKICQYQRLNPYLREAYLIKYNSGNATIVTGKEVFTKRAMRNKDFKGMEAGIVVLRGNEIINRTGAILIQGEQLIGGWAKVYKNNYQVPVESLLSFAQFRKHERILPL